MHEHLCNRSRALDTKDVAANADKWCKYEARLRVRAVGGGEQKWPRKTQRRKAAFLATDVSFVSILLCIRASPSAAKPSSPIALYSRLRKNRESIRGITDGWVERRACGKDDVVSALTLAW